MTKVHDDADELAQAIFELVAENIRPMPRPELLCAALMMLQIDIFAICKGLNRPQALEAIVKQLSIIKDMFDEED